MFFNFWLASELQLLCYFFNSQYLLLMPGPGLAVSWVRSLFWLNHRWKFYNQVLQSLNAEFLFESHRPIANGVLDQPQQVEPKSIAGKKTPPKIINPFFNNFKQVKIIVKFWGYVSRAVFEILTFKKPNFEPKSKVKVRNLVVLAIFSTFMQIS